VNDSPVVDAVLAEWEQTHEPAESEQLLLVATRRDFGAVERERIAPRQEKVGVREEQSRRISDEVDEFFANSEDARSDWGVRVAELRALA
jgi:hypothetical protein